MDGLLVIDKPAGPTSHDVVARLRRALKERRIGHTGTLDPAATGVLLIVIGRATRLARFLSAATKSYEAVIRLGVATDTADAEGTPIGAAHDGPLPSREAIDAALDAFRGEHLQQPPAFSAKKIAGRRSYRLARAARGLGSASEVDLRGSPQRFTPEVDLRGSPQRLGAEAGPAPVTVSAEIELLALEDDKLTVSVDCTSGFYVRSLAHDLGVRLGTGAHVAALRRTRSGPFTLEHAIALDVAERDPARARLVSLADMLPHFPTVVLTRTGVRRATHGCELGPADTVGGAVVPASPAGEIRMLDESGALVGIGQARSVGGLLHPFVVLM